MLYIRPMKIRAEEGEKLGKTTIFGEITNFIKNFLNFLNMFSSSQMQIRNNASHSNSAVVTQRTGAK